ncbi:serine/threonine-protein kinase [Micromonospora sonneratiae]|uniref:non-specific serine/threonine protein kinase n=1 Tax=Micromonospora sonneratiae TaxID=1184706 RepID=A0ABW3YIN1_9ACTN
MAVHQVLIARRYRLLHQVGSGGMGRVWLARDEMLHRDVAVKELRPPDWLTESERDELNLATLREARTAARLSHPNVVQIYDVVHADDKSWIVMEYVRSRSLHQVVTSTGPLPPRRTAEIGLAVLAALRAAHSAGVLHRDVKPHNVLVADDGRVVLTDFGLAKFDGGDGATTRPGLVLGSPQYVAPERAADGSSSVQSDLWSLGATLYTAVEGRAPYARPTAMATLTALATEGPDPMRLAGPLRPVLAGLLHRDPRRRLATGQVERLLREVVGPPPSGPATGPPSVTVPDVSTSPDSHRSLSISVFDELRVLSASFADGVPDLEELPATTDEVPTGTAGSVTASPPTGPSPQGRSRGTRWLAGALMPVAGLALGLGVAVHIGGWHDPTPPVGTERDGTADGGTPANLDRPAGTVGGRDSPGPDPTASGRQPTTSARRPGPFACTAPTGPAAATPVASVPPPPGERFALVSGWTWYTDPAGGFRIAVPAGWLRFTDGTTTCFQEPEGARVLSVDASVPPADDANDAVRYWHDEERRVRAGGGMSDYQQIGITPIDFYRGGAEWECRWTGARGEPVHTVRLLFSTSATRAYAVSWLTREFDWQVNRAYLPMLRQSFRPTTS